MNKSEDCSNSELFRRQLNRVRDGSQDAAAALISEFGPHVYRVIRRRLDRRLRAKIDSEDMFQLVWASFFRYPERMGRFTQSHELLRFLSVVARNKVIHGGRKYRRVQKNDMSREVSLMDSSAPDWIAQQRIQSPSQVAMAKERFERMLEGLSRQHQRILCLRVAGTSYVAIAAELGLHERTVRKVVERLARKDLATLARDDGSGDSFRAGKG